MIHDRGNHPVVDAAFMVVGTAVTAALFGVGILYVSHQHGLGELGEAVNRVEAAVKIYFFLGVAVIFVAGLVTWVAAEIVAARPPRLATRDAMVRGAGRLLPATVRQEHVEEWRSWLRDLREAGEPRRRRLVEMLSILFVAAPRLAVILRLDRRAVE